MTVGAKLKHLRKNSNMTLEELGKQIGVAAQTIYKYEEGIVANIPLDRFKSLAKAFNVTPDYLLSWSRELDNLNQKAYITSDSEFFPDKTYANVEPVSQSKLSSEAIAFANKVEKLSPEKQVIIEQIIDAFLAAEAKINP